MEGVHNDKTEHLGERRKIVLFIAGFNIFFKGNRNTTQRTNVSIMILIWMQKILGK